MTNHNAIHAPTISKIKLPTHKSLRHFENPPPSPNHLNSTTTILTPQNNSSIKNYIHQAQIQPQDFVFPRLNSWTFSRQGKKSEKAINEFTSLEFKSCESYFTWLDQWPLFMNTLKIELCWFCSFTWQWYFPCCLKSSYEQIWKSYFQCSKNHDENFINSTNVFLVID